MEQKQAFLEKCLAETEQFKVSFADTRIFSDLNENITMRNGQIETARIRSEEGFNVRVILNGAWGYACSSKVEDSEIPKVVKKAIEIAKASAQKLRKPVVLTEEPIVKGTYETPYQIDPFDVDFEEKIEILKKADSILRNGQDQIKVNKGILAANRFTMAFANSEGSRVNQIQTFITCYVSANAVGTETQLRSSLEAQMKGFEFVKEFDFEAEATRIAKEVLILVNEAENFPKEKIAFILEPTQLGLTIHESTGHPTELDRALGFEADFAGTSFLTVDKLGTNYRYGSELVNLVVDPTIPGGLGSIKYDDEGVETKKFYIVENGIFKNYMTDRETAHEIGYKHSFGNARISNYNRIPIVRMGNLHLAPDPSGPKDIEALIAETKRGVYGLTWKSHSIDDKRLNFQFSVELGWLIENGERTKPLKNVCYNASTPDFWNGCDMITQKFINHGMGQSCGKGVPMQGMWISHGGGWARFQNVNVFSS
ncbi:MAG: TldD/PmbA family protein [Candidatus Hodarchaeota archaeon]